MAKNAKDSRSQSQKFSDAARAAGAREDEAAFDNALKGIAKAPPPKSVQARKLVHASDCAVHNGPAYEAGPCDCGAEAKARG